VCGVLFWLLFLVCFVFIDFGYVWWCDGWRGVSFFDFVLGGGLGVRGWLFYFICVWCGWVFFLWYPTPCMVEQGMQLPDLIVHGKSEELRNKK